MFFASLKTNGKETDRKTETEKRGTERQRPRGVGEKEIEEGETDRERKTDRHRNIDRQTEIQTEKDRQTEKEVYNPKLFTTIHMPNTPSFSTVLIWDD